MLRFGHPVFVSRARSAERPSERTAAVELMSSLDHAHSKNSMLERLANWWQSVARGPIAIEPSA